MAYLRCYFEKFRNLITNTKFIVAWSVFYTLFLGVKCVFDFRIKMLAENGNFADFFINYSGGFVRRGLLGQVFLWCHQMNINPLWAAAIFASLVFLMIALYMISEFRKHNYNLCILTVGWFLGDFGLYGLTFMRRDYFVMCSFLLTAWLWKRMGIMKWLLLANVLVSITILCYEPFALFSIPFCILLTRLKLRSWWKSLVCWLLPVISFFVCCKYAGGKDVYDAIVASTHEFVHNPGMMMFLQRGSVDAMKFHLHCNFMSVSNCIPVIILSFVSLSAMVYYCVNAIPVFSQSKKDFANRRYILTYLLCAFAFLSPMFTCLSTDYARTCVYVCLASFILFFTLNDKEKQDFLPSRIYRWADKLLNFTDKHLHPTRFKIVFIMLFIGISGWTGAGLRGFLCSSEAGAMAFQILHLLKKIVLYILHTQF